MSESEWPKRCDALLSQWIETISSNGFYGVNKDMQIYFTGYPLVLLLQDTLQIDQGHSLLCFGNERLLE
jgi:hypothetical protein